MHVVSIDAIDGDDDAFYCLILKVGLKLLKKDACVFPSLLPCCITYEDLDREVQKRRGSCTFVVNGGQRNLCLLAGRRLAPSRLVAILLRKMQMKFKSNAYSSELLDKILFAVDHANETTSKRKKNALRTSEVCTYLWLLRPSVVLFMLVMSVKGE